MRSELEGSLTSFLFNKNGEVTPWADIRCRVCLNWPFRESNHIPHPWLSPTANLKTLGGERIFRISDDEAHFDVIIFN